MCFCKVNNFFDRCLLYLCSPFWTTLSRLRFHHNSITHRTYHKLFLFFVPGFNILIMFFLPLLPVLHLAGDHFSYVFTFLFYAMTLAEQFAFNDISAFGAFVFDFFAEYFHSTSPYTSSLISCSSVISFALIPSHKFLYCKELYSLLILLTRISNGLSLCKK